METLPVEMIEMITQYLTPEDLARCSAVSRKWREIFNNDWMWKPHCDPELEEPLRTIPCVATPAFVAPEAENSTLSPICHWKLAFMREKHLWKNWGRMQRVSMEEHIIVSKNNQIANVEFLTDTLLVVWYSDKIEILDVSVLPATLVARTDTLVNILDKGECFVSGTNKLLVIKGDSIEIFNVDIMNQSINSMHRIHFRYHCAYVKNEFFLYSNEEKSKLIILDLNTRIILNEQPCPVENTQNEEVEIWAITSSTACDFVAVTFRVVANDGYRCFKHYIYSFEEHTFLPGPVAFHDEPNDFERYSISLYGTWLALMIDNTLKVLNFRTQDVLLAYDENSSNRYGLFVCIEKTHECCNGFIFWGYNRDDLEYLDPVTSWIKYYRPSDRTLTIAYEDVDALRGLFKKFSNKLIRIDNSSVLKHSGQMFENVHIGEWTWTFRDIDWIPVEDNSLRWELDRTLKKGFKVNRSCTKVLTEFVWNVQELHDVYYVQLYLW